MANNPSCGDCENLREVDLDSQRGIRTQCKDYFCGHPAIDHLPLVDLWCGFQPCQIDQCPKKELEK